MAVTVEFVDGSATLRGHEWSSTDVYLESDLNEVFILHGREWLGGRYHPNVEGLIAQRTIEFLDDGVITQEDPFDRPLGRIM